MAVSISIFTSSTSGTSDWLMHDSCSKVLTPSPHCSYVNMPVFERTDYLKFLGKFDKLSHVKKEEKLKPGRAVEYKK